MSATAGSRHKAFVLREGTAMKIRWGKKKRAEGGRTVRIEIVPPDVLDVTKFILFSAVLWKWLLQPLLQEWELL